MAGEVLLFERHQNYATITLNLIPKNSQSVGDVFVQEAVDLRESGC